MVPIRTAFPALLVLLINIALLGAFACVVVLLIRALLKYLRSGKSPPEQAKSLAEALKGSQVMPAAQCRLLELAQRSGAGDSAMEKIAADLSEESEYALEEAVSRVEPALVLVCSVLVGLILLSVMLPLMHIMAAIG